MKRCLLKTASVVALLVVILLPRASDDRTRQPVVEPDAVSATLLDDAGLPLPGSAVSGGGVRVESANPRAMRLTGARGLAIAPRGAPLACGNGHGCGAARSLDSTSRLIRGGIHTSSLGTPPPGI